MKRPLFTKFSVLPKWRNCLPLLIWLGSVLGMELGAQTCATLNLNPNAYLCQTSTAQSYVINNFDAGNSYSFELISGVANINYISGQNIVNITWSSPGDIVFRMVETDLTIPVVLCTPDTFRIRVGSQFAPQVNCNDTINVSLDEFCRATVTPDMVIEGGGYDPRDYNVVIRDLVTKQIISTSPSLNNTHIGKLYEVSAVHRCSGNFCWGILRVEDKLKPRIACRRVEVDCGAGTLPTSPGVGFPKPSPAAPNPLAVPGQANTYQSSSALYDACGVTRFTYSDRIVHVDCPPAVPFIDTIFRQWTAVDNYGNDSTCVDTILIRAGSIANIGCPPSYDGLNGNPDPLQCNGNFAKDNNGNPHPSVTGFPTGVNCRNINYTYTDIRLGVCAGSYKILREWFIADWCTGEDTTCVQLIKIIDDRGPLIRCPLPNFDTVYTLPYECYGNHELGLPTLIAPECSNPLTYELLVKRNVPDRTIPPSSIEATTDGVFRRMNGNTLIGYRVENLPVGLNWLIYRVTDACGNSSECAKEVVVVENTKPIAVCHFETNVTLTRDGWAKIDAVSLDDGSHDNCEMGGFKVMRMDSSSCGGHGNTTFDDYIEFCCNDVSPTVPVIVRLLVIDRAGNTNECMVRVFVHDKQPPVVECLPNITVSCLYDYSDYSKFGTYRRNEADRRNIIINDPNNTDFAQPRIWGRDGLVIEDCNLKIDSSESVSQRACGLNVITRRFTFRDDFNPQITCTQLITVKNFNPFQGSTIKWPNDTALVGCLSQVDSSIAGAPRWPNTYRCANVVASYEDEVFNQVENVCFKILRKWTVIDWCQYVPNVRPEVGIWRYTQVIKVVNKDKPTFTSSCNNVTFDVVSSDCNGQVSLIATAQDFCGHTTDLAYSYKIDYNNNGSIDINGNTNNASGVYPVGTHRITWTVEDRCGNTQVCSYTFTLRDRKAPSPVCRAGIITVIMPTSGNVEIWGRDLDVASFDNCTPNNLLDFSLSRTQRNVPARISCSHLRDGISLDSTVTIYITDQAGNQDFCTTKIIVQDGLGNACPDNLGGGGTQSLATVTGSISTEQSKSLEEAMVELNGNMPSLPKYHMTLNDGKYVFASIPSSENYSLSASKNDDMSNGVTTNDIVIIQKHILGIQNISNPYKIIAADVNNSRSITARDISDLRKLILGINENLPAGKSWVFVDANQTFNNPSAPWPYRETLALTNPNGEIQNQNFVAVKLGDVNNSAQTSQLAGVQTRTLNKAVLHLNDFDFQLGEEIRIPVSLTGMQIVSGMQLELKFNPDAIEFVELKSQKIAVDISNMNPYLIQDGILRLSVDQVNGFDTESTLFELVFKAKKNGQVKELIHLDQKNFAPEAYDASGEIYSLNLGFRSGSENSGDANGFVLYQNRPNPFYTVTDISFFLPKDDEASLKICDVNGKVLRQITKKYTSGLHTIQINNKELDQSGILYYSLETSEFRAVKKMILIK